MEIRDKIVELEQRKKTLITKQEQLIKNKHIDKSFIIATELKCIKHTLFHLNNLKAK